MQTFIAVHGGVGNSIFDNGRIMVDAVSQSNNDIVEAIKILENNGRFNCGYGSNLTRNGNVECEAAYCSSQGIIFGAVGAVSRIRNPIVAASLIAQQQLITGECDLIPPCTLVSSGAEQWARSMGVDMCEPQDLLSDSAKLRWKRALEIVKEHSNHDEATLEAQMDTVGGVAVKSDGSCSAASSTGGILLKSSGRLGHCAQSGCCVWAERNSLFSVAVSVSGSGETIAMSVLANKLASSLLNIDTSEQLPVECVKFAIENFFCNCPWIVSRCGQHKIVGGLAIFCDRGNDVCELISFSNAPNLEYAFGISASRVRHDRIVSASKSLIVQAVPFKMLWTSSDDF